MRAHILVVSAECARLITFGMVLALAGSGEFRTCGQASGEQITSPSTNRFVCRTWRVEDGLPQESVWAIAQTRDGYLWIGTGGGLARFDGVRFKVFGLAEGLPSLHVRALLQDRQGALWIGTANGLCRYQAGRFTTWTTKDGLAAENIGGLAEDSEGAIWISTYGLSRWRHGMLENIGAPADLGGDLVRSVVADKNGAIWIATANRGLLRWQGDRLVPAIGTPETLALRPVKLLKDRRGRIWASGPGQVWCFEDGSMTSYGQEEGLPDVLLTCLSESADGTIWAGSSNRGLYYLRRGRFSVVHQADGLSDEAVRAIAEDREGNLWVGTRDRGLNRLRPRILSTRRIRENQTEVLAATLAESEDGALWVGTVGHGLYRLIGEKQEPVLREALRRVDPQVNAVLATSDGSVWFSSGRMLFQWQAGELRSTYRGSEASSLCEDGQGGLWLGSPDGVLRRLQQGSFASFTNDLPHGPLTALARDAEGALWIGSYGGGLGRLKDGHCTVFRRQEGLGSDLVRTLHLGSRGALWIGTEGGGLSWFKAGRIGSLSKQHGLADDTVLQILEDDDANLWLGTQHGIIRVSRKDLDNLTEGAAAYIHPRVFGHSEGLESEQCVGGFGACLRTRKGQLCFATGRGIVTIDPGRPADTKAPPTVWLEEVWVDGQPQALEDFYQDQRPGDYSLTAALRIPPGRQRLEFHYTGLDLTAPEKVRFRHRLDGLDNDWVEAGARRVAYYNHLAPGTYRFGVTACNNDGVWNEQGASLKVTLLPHYWQTWWFRLLAGAILLGLVAGTVRHLERRRLREQMRRLEQDRAMERERARIARDIHDDLGARLTKISKLTEQAQRLAPDGPANEPVLSIQSTAQEMLGRLDETVWAVNPRNDRLDRLVDYILNYAEEFLRPTNIRCRLKVVGEIPPLTIAAEPRHHLFLAVKEALNNAARHSGASEVQLQLEFAEGVFRVQVLDNGRGFHAAEALARGRGLENMRSRLELMSGEWELQSQPGQGTTLKMGFRLPESGAALEATGP
jgi:ligand-binding sensor domain-containing protein/signal transduction histidine kinase